MNYFLLKRFIKTFFPPQIKISLVTLFTIQNGTPLRENVVTIITASAEDTNQHYPDYIESPHLLIIHRTEERQIANEV